MARRPVAANLGSDDDQQDDPTLRAPGADDQQQDDQQNDEQDDQQDDAQDDDVLRAGGEQQDENQDDHGEQQDEQPEPRRRRADRDADVTAREAAMLERVEAAERTARETQARLEALTRQQTPQETPEQEASRLALMTPQEIVRYNQKKVEEALTLHDKRMNAATLQAANVADKAAFHSKIERHPQWSKLGPEVEKRHAALVAQGQYPTRETVLTYVLGEQAMKLGAKAGTEQRERQQRVERQQTRPNNARSDVRQERRGGNRTLEQRLENVQL